MIIESVGTLWRGAAPVDRPGNTDATRAMIGKSFMSVSFFDKDNQNNRNYIALIQEKNKKNLRAV